MSETNAQEPTMEEILASIRRIISEDDAPPAAGDPTTPFAAEPQPHGEPAPYFANEPAFAASPVRDPAPEPAHDEDDDVLELTHPLAATPPQEPPQADSRPAPPHFGDLDLADPPAAPAQKEDALVSGYTASAAASSFSSLSRSVAMPADGRTLEDVVNMLLKPLLKDWLDRNLPSIVENRVQTEVERISRSRGH